MKVRAPDGRVWKVRRKMRWPRWRRYTGPAEDWADPAWWIDAPVGDGFPTQIVLALVAVTLITALVLLVAPLVVFIVEAVVVAAAALALGRPWLVVASTSGPPSDEKRWLVGGFRTSRRAVKEVAD